MTTGAAKRERGIALAANHCADEQVKPGTDEEFMRELYERYRPQLQNYVVRLTRDVQWAEDVVQGALVRAWRARQQADPRRGGDSQLAVQRRLPHFC